MKSLRISNFRDVRVTDTKLIDRIPEKRIDHFRFQVSLGQK